MMREGSASVDCIENKNTIIHNAKISRFPDNTIPPVFLLEYHRLYLNCPGQRAEGTDQEYPAQAPQDHHHIAAPAQKQELGVDGGYDASGP